MLWLVVFAIVLPHAAEDVPALRTTHAVHQHQAVFPSSVPLLPERSDRVVEIRQPHLPSSLQNALLALLTTLRI